MRAPRWVHRLYARTFGYFWLPCPLCGRMSVGHEWRDYDGLPSSIPVGPGGSYRGICPTCTKAGRGVQQPPSRLAVDEPAEAATLDQLGAVGD